MKVRRFKSIITGALVVSSMGIMACGGKSKGMPQEMIEETYSIVSGVDMPIITQSQTQETTTQNKIDYSVYDELIRKTTNGLSNGFTSKEMTELDLADAFYTSKMVARSAGYMIKDLDGNGIDELILGVNGEDSYYAIYDIFTIDNGELKHVVKGAERSKYYICTNGMLENIGSSGANYTSYAYYNYTGTSLELKECVFTDDRLPGYKYFYSKVAPYDSDAVPMLDEDAEVLKGTYKVEQLRFTLFVK